MNCAVASKFCHLNSFIEKRRKYNNFGLFFPQGNKRGVIPFHEKSDTDVNPESFAASKFFNCELRIANCELV
ncbi:hypothetical protein IJ00_17925 [Calothrix sp. 336/3]|nr:hypothetical protein IJ00_17925 [Calothrix sp. 336/3]